MEHAGIRNRRKHVAYSGRDCYGSMGARRQDADRMSYTVSQIADGVWTHATRTVDAGTPDPSNGTILDDIAYAVWTNAVRTLDGGGSVAVVVNETMPAPSQSANAVIGIAVSIAESLPSPSQSVLADFIPAAAKKPLGAGGPRGAWSYYPPVYPVKTKVLESLPIPVQSAIFSVSSRISVVQMCPAPRQIATVKARRGIKALDEEDRIIMLLLGVA